MRVEGADRLCNACKTRRLNSGQSDDASTRNLGAGPSKEVVVTIGSQH